MPGSATHICQAAARRSISLLPHQPGLRRLNQAFIAHRRNGWHAGSCLKPSDWRIACASSVARSLWSKLWFPGACANKRAAAILARTALVEVRGANSRKSAATSVALVVPAELTEEVAVSCMPGRRNHVPDPALHQLRRRHPSRGRAKLS